MFLEPVRARRGAFDREGVDAVERGVRVEPVPALGDREAAVLLGAPFGGVPVDRRALLARVGLAAVGVPQALVLVGDEVFGGVGVRVAVGVGIDSDWTKWKEGYFPNIAAQIGGAYLGNWLTLAALISAAGMLNALLCTSARVPYAMAERGMLPHAFCRLHRQHATPWVAIAVNAIGVSLLIPFSFQDLIEIDMFLYAAALILEFAALIWLRIKAPDLPRPFRIPLGTAGVVALSMPPLALCLASMALANDATKYVSLGGIALGLLLYRWQSKSLVETEIEPAPTL